MAAAVIISVAVGIWVGGAYIRNKVAWDSARSAKGRLDAAKRRRWATAGRMLWPVGLLTVLGLAIAASPDQITVTPDGGISSAFYTLTIAALLLVGWLVFRYADAARTWKGTAESKSTLSDARKKRWATLWPAIFAVTVLVGLVAIVITTGASG
jgi:hypothetical protein